MRVQHWVYTIPLRLRSLFRRNAVERELDEEFQFHIDQQVQIHLAKGLTPSEARVAALHALGGMTQRKEECREMRKLNWIDNLAQDARYAARMLRKTPGFTTVAVLSLALGIGANTAIFTLLNAVILRLLPIRAPQQLMQFTYTIPGNWNSFFGYQQLEHFRSQANTLSRIFGGTSLGRVNVAFRGTAGLAVGDAYTDNFFTVLGVAPQHGRVFVPGDDPQAFAMVLSNRYWRVRFGADPSVVGETVTINQTPFTVVGIAPPEFSGIALDHPPDFWVPLHALDRFNPSREIWEQPFTSWLAIAGRLRPGVSQAQAQAELDVIHRRLLVQQLATVERPGAELKRWVSESHLMLRPAENGLVSGLRDTYAFPLKLLMWIAGVVLVIA